MKIDYERVVIGLKAFYATKRSFGQDELNREVIRLEVESRLPESQTEFDPRPAPLQRPDEDEALRLEEPQHTAAVA